MLSKRCPYCAEEVSADAIVCKHCRSNLARQPVQPPAARQADNRGEIKRTEQRTTLILFVTLLIVGVVLSILMGSC